MPREVFVDPFELAEAAKFGGNVTRVVSRHAVDLEVFVFCWQVVFSVTRMVLRNAVQFFVNTIV